MILYNILINDRVFNLGFDGLDGSNSVNLNLQASEHYYRGLASYLLLSGFISNCFIFEI